MKTAPGTKVTLNMPDGLRWPAVAVGDETQHPTIVVDRKTNEKVEIIVTRNDFISLRTSKAGETYPRLSNEAVMYGYKIVTDPRVSPVVGLDVDADGVLISPQTLLDQIAESNAAFRTAAFEARHGVTAADDL